MGKAIQLEKNGRQLELRVLVTAGDWQIWVFEKGAKIYLYEIVPFDDSADSRKMVESTLRRARNEIENDSITVPVARQWPRPFDRTW